MGLLDSIFGGGNAQRGGSGGGLSPIVLALLGLLATRGLQGKGLGDILGGSLPTGNSTPGTPPGGQSIDRGAGQAPGGGLGDLLSDLMRGAGGGSAGGGRAPGPGGGGLGDILGGLGGLLGGAGAGTVLSGGLGDLLKQFQQNGLGNAADTWVGRGENQRLSAEDIERALGRDTLSQLSQQTGTPYNQVLSDLSESLPDAVDQLTPEGRLPTQEEAGRWL